FLRKFDLKRGKRNDSHARGVNWARLEGVSPRLKSWKETIALREFTNNCEFSRCCGSPAFACRYGEASRPALRGRNRNGAALQAFKSSAIGAPRPALALARSSLGYHIAGLQPCPIWLMADPPSPCGYGAARPPSR